MYFYICNQKSKIKEDLWYQSKTTSKRQNIISKTILKVILLCVWTLIFSYQPLCLEHELLVSCWMLSCTDHRVGKSTVNPHFIPIFIGVLSAWQRPFIGIPRCLKSESHWTQGSLCLYIQSPVLCALVPLFIKTPQGQYQPIWERLILWLNSLMPVMFFS